MWTRRRSSRLGIEAVRLFHDGVARLDLFGSAAGEGFDLYLGVSFEPRNPFRLSQRYFGLEEDPEALFGLKADLVM